MKKRYQILLSIEDGVYGKDGCIGEKIQRTRIVA
ncbi:hypothetical protein SDC9_69803 [bioreactor metagenome]|uniref:Uncharacterized protein n=1 Tax=bioreactor metagenome TaxID=1076179 RepID=A0A644Y432_9ZZZZ